MRFFVGLCLVVTLRAQPEVRIAVIGDRTGSHQPGVFEAVWKEVAAWKPAMAITIGDWIEGGNDGKAEAEWRELERFRPDFPLHFVAGNHDIWSARSRQIYERFTGRKARYSFDAGGAHFVVLDNAQQMELPQAELDFLEKDLAAWKGSGPRFVLFHQPGWLLNVLVRQPDFRLHQIAKKYNVTAVISGHTHMYKRLELDGITYLTVGSSGGAIRGRDPLGKGFAEGFFYGYTQLVVQGAKADIVAQELGAPFGKARRVGVAYAEK